MTKRDPLVVTVPDILSKVEEAAEKDPDFFGKNAERLAATIEANQELVTSHPWEGRDWSKDPPTFEEKAEFWRGVNEWNAKNGGGVYHMSYHPAFLELPGLRNDENLSHWAKSDLVDEVIRLRNGIRAHRDSNGHNLCWYHPELWGLLPEKVEPSPEVPPKEEFLQCCAQYRDSLDKKV